MFRIKSSFQNRGSDPYSFVILTFLSSFLVFSSAYAETFHMYAPALKWGDWTKAGPAYIGSMAFDISYSAVGDTLVMGRVKYLGNYCKEIEAEFKDEITIQTGNCVDNVFLSFKGVPLGSAVDGNID